MAAEKLTKRIVDALKAPKPSKVGVKVRETFVWDRELRGFGVQVMPSGLKSFVIQYRTAEGRLRRSVIGRFGLMTVEEARDLAHEKLVAVSKGVDPVAAEAEDTGRITVAELCDWYLTEAEAGRILRRRRKDRQGPQRQPRRRDHRGRRRRRPHPLDAARDLRARGAPRQNPEQPRQGRPPSRQRTTRPKAQPRRDPALWRDHARGRAGRRAPDRARGHPFPAADRVSPHGGSWHAAAMAR